MKSIRSLAILLLILFVSSVGKGQNLVPNGDFEIYDDCPANLSGIAFSPNYNSFPTVASWVNPLKNSTPDYLNSCAQSNTGVKVPMSIFGYQPAYNGNAYAGIIAWDGQFSNGNLSFDYSEYIQNQLSQTLQAGHKYCVNFYVSPTITSSFSFNYVGIQDIGINFSGTNITNTTDYTLSLQTQVGNPSGNYLTDTNQWYKVHGIYTASGGERWITLGCFRNGNNPPPFVPVYPATPDPNYTYRCYMYIDGVSITEITSADTVLRSHDTLVCQSTGLSITLTAASGASSYLWNNGNMSGHIVAGDTGVYWCRSAVDCGLLVDTFHIKFTSSPKLNLGSDTANCFLQPITLSANNTYDKYLWNNGDTSQSVTALISGAYILTVSSYCGAQTDTVNVSIQAPTLPPLVTDTIICQDVFDPKIDVKGSNIKWYTSMFSNTASLFQPFISTVQYGTQQWFVTQTIGQCESSKVPVNIRIRYKPYADIGNYFTICRNTDTVQLGHEYPEVDYLWNTNEFVCCIIPEQTGTYRLTISNECGTSSDTAFVEMSDCDDCIFMPNAFTPNDDARNDLFLPVIKCPVTDYKLSIYNRWGQCIFSTQDTGAGWDGKMGDAFAPLGTYIYVMKCKSVTTGLEKNVRGNVTVIR